MKNAHAFRQFQVHPRVTLNQLIANTAQALVHALGLLKSQMSPHHHMYLYSKMPP